MSEEKGKKDKWEQAREDWHKHVDEIIDAQKTIDGALFNFSPSVVMLCPAGMVIQGEGGGLVWSLALALEKPDFCALLQKAMEANKAMPEELRDIVKQTENQHCRHLREDGDNIASVVASISAEEAEKG